MAPRTEDRIKEIVQQWIYEGWEKGDSGIVDKLHSPDFIDHDSGGRSPDNEGFKQGIINLFAAFPDLTAKIDDIIPDLKSSLVAVRWSATGTHRGEYLGANPSGKAIRFKGIEILRIRNNQIVERWGEWDGIDLLEQLDRVKL